MLKLQFANLLRGYLFLFYHSSSTVISNQGARQRGPAVLVAGDVWHWVCKVGMSPVSGLVNWIKQASARSIQTFISTWPPLDGDGFSRGSTKTKTDAADSSPCPLQSPLAPPVCQCLPHPNNVASFFYRRRVLMTWLLFECSKTVSTRKSSRARTPTLGRKRFGVLEKSNHLCGNISKDRSKVVSRTRHRRKHGNQFVQVIKAVIQDVSFGLVGR